MQEKQLSERVPYLEKWLIIGLVLASGFGLGIVIVRFSLGWRELIILTFAVVAILAILVPDDRILRMGLGLGVASIALGWRTVSITPDLSFSPFEFVIWFLAGTLPFKYLFQQEKMRFRLSLPMKLFLLFSLPACAVAWSSGVPLDRIIGYGKNIVLIAPFFFVIPNLIRSLETWKRLMLVAIGTSIYLSLTGLSLIVVPSLGQALSAGLETQLVPTVEGFTRVGFAGWGPLAAWFFILVFGVVLGFWESTQNRLHRLTYLGILLLIGGGILVSGQRGAWAALLAGLVLYGVLNPQRGLILVALAGVLILILPEANFATRFASAFDPALFDSSAADRYYRAGIALKAIADNPLLGLGFGVLTFVHSDYLEIGAGMGLFALALFVAALGTTGWRISRIQFGITDNQTRLLARGTVIMFVTLLVELMSAGFVTLSFTAVITWFFWAMSDQFATLVEESRQVSSLAG